MEEKTAKIPSLKEFKDSRKEKDAQFRRTSSMQTKKQLKKSVSKESHKEKEKRPQQGNSRQRADSKRESVKRESQKKASHQNTKSSRRPSENHRAQIQEERKPQTRTYVRDRVSEEKKTNHPERTSRTMSYSDSQPLRQYRSQSTRSATRVERTPSVPKKVNTAPKKKKPVSPMARKFRNIMVYLGIVAVVLIVALVLSLTVLFKTEQIIVSGNEMYTAEEIRAASGISLGENIFMANKSAASERIEKQYPYIEEANVYFSIPDSIKIDITMAKPSYMIEASSGFYVVSDKGKVLEVVATDDEAKVPMIEGVTVEAKVPGEYLEYGSDVVTEGLTEIFTAFRELGSKNVTAVNVETKEDTVKFRYVHDDRIVVYLGPPDNLYHKVHTADTIIKEKLDVNGSEPVGELDVSDSYNSKKSYFNEYSILAENVAPTTGPTSATEATEPKVDEYYYYE